MARIMKFIVIVWQAKHRGVLFTFDNMDAAVNLMNALKRAGHHGIELYDTELAKKLASVD